jgi:hypothetical protein
MSIETPNLSENSVDDISKLYTFVYLYSTLASICIMGDVHYELFFSLPDILTWSPCRQHSSLIFIRMQGVF